MSKYGIIHPKVHGGILNVKVPRSQRYLTTAQGAAIAKMFVAAKRRHKPIVRSGHCQVIFFKKPGGGLVAVQRCENRHTFKSSRFKAAAAKRARKLCRDKKRRFRRCR